MFSIIFGISFRLFLKEEKSKDKLLLSKILKYENIVCLKSNKIHNQFKNNIAIKANLYTNLRKISFFFLFLIDRYKRALKKSSKFVTKKELIRKIYNKKANTFC